MRGRRLGLPADNQTMTCPVCETTFLSNRAHQKYCTKACQLHTLNKRRLEKQGRKSTREPFLAPKLILKRAKAVREKWSETERKTHDHLNPEMRIFPEKPVLSQAQRVRIHIQDDNKYGALKIASAWPKLGGIREAVETAWKAYQHPEGFENANELVEAGIEALAVYLKIDSTGLSPGGYESPRLAPGGP